jgi:hypothetical protein
VGSDVVVMLNGGRVMLKGIVAEAWSLGDALSVTDTVRLPENVADGVPVMVQLFAVSGLGNPVMSHV